MLYFFYFSIEGNPFIIRFKTSIRGTLYSSGHTKCIEGNPFIIRFKTTDKIEGFKYNIVLVLKVIHL